MKIDPRNPFIQRAFTLIELLVVIATLGLLTAFLLPVMAKSTGKIMSISAQCQNNQRRLAIAAIMYADENKDWWLPNMPGASPAWCAGRMDFNSANTDNTNIALLTDPTRSLIAPYLPNPRILHCPADMSFVLSEGTRVRSVSMNQAVGTSFTSVCGQPVPCPVNGQWLSGNNVGSGCNQSGFGTYAKTSDMVGLVPSLNRGINASPAQIFVFADQHADSISDGSFAVQCALTGPFASIIDYPAGYHDGAGSFSFADGHVELHKWIGQGIQLPVVWTGGALGSRLPHPANDSAVQDVPWLQQHTSLVK